MKHFRIRFLCPDCGQIHQYTYLAWNPVHAHMIFSREWREVNEILGEDIQLPLAKISEVKYDHEV